MDDPNWSGGGGEEEEDRKDSRLALYEDKKLLFSETLLYDHRSSSATGSIDETLVRTPLPQGASSLRFGALAPLRQPTG